MDALSGWQPNRGAATQHPGGCVDPPPGQVASMPVCCRYSATSIGLFPTEASMPQLPFPRPPAWLWLIAAAGVSLSLLAASLVRDARLEDTEQQFASAADQITLRIEERLAAYALVLRGAAGLFDASEEVDRDE